MTTSGTTPIRKSVLNSSIFLRVAASIFFIPCFVIITNTGGKHFVLLVNAVIFVGMWEFYRMMEMEGIRPYKGIGILAGGALAWYMFFHEGVYANVFLTVVLVTLMCLEVARRDQKSSVFHIGATILGVMYVGYLASHLVMLREFPLGVNADYRLGASLVFLAFIVTWAGDTGAYIVGSLVGRTPLLPRVSERKTWEGAIGGLLFSIGGAFVARATLAPFLSWWHALLLGLLAAVAGQLGDLFESVIKRGARLKDASDTIPGHGGVLDRFDSLLFTAPLIYYFIKFVVFK